MIGLGLGLGLQLRLHMTIEHKLWTATGRRPHNTAPCRFIHLVFTIVGVFVGGDDEGRTVREGFDRQRSFLLCLNSDTEPTQGSSVTSLRRLQIKT